MGKSHAQLLQRMVPLPDAVLHVQAKVQSARRQGAPVLINGHLKDGSENARRILLAVVHVGGEGVGARYALGYVGLDEDADLALGVLDGLGAREVSVVLFPLVQLLQLLISDLRRYEINA